MRETLRKRFGNQQPRAVVIDDNARARLMTARRLRERGFEVAQYASMDQFLATWKPGTVDVVIADWQLSEDPRSFGDKVLEAVRKRDWDVPFVLVSGKLQDSDDRARILQILLEGGSARFVRRGSDGIRIACDEAEDLIERRDLSLVKTVLALRDAALADASVMTSSGNKLVSSYLARIVQRPETSQNAGDPIAKARAMRANVKKTKK